MRYSDKIVLITGGSSGIGKGCARVFAEAGATVLICSNQQEQGLEAAAELQTVALQRGTGEVSFIYCDVESADDIANFVQTAIAKYGRIDCLINNAGRHPPHKPIDEFSIDEFRVLINLNLMSIFTACKAALPHLRKCEGNIINIASLVGTIGQRHAVTYAATKGAIIAFTKSLAIDEAPNGVRVNSVSPGNIYTPMWQEAIDAAPDPDAFRAEGEAAQVMGRMGSPEEVGRLCLFIAADGTYTTGVDHIISGGAEIGYGRKRDV
jgi:NAD(P)-dependent dehydrogenase (short-subunit alcohol dehydrogenase family)